MSSWTIVWTYASKTCGFDKNWRKHPSELWSVGEEETECCLMAFEFYFESFTAAILDNFCVKFLAIKVYNVCCFCSFRRRFLQMWQDVGVYLGVKTCEVFLCLVTIMFVLSIVLTSLFSLFYVTREGDRFLHRGWARCCATSCRMSSKL